MLQIYRQSTACETHPPCVGLLLLPDGCFEEWYNNYVVLATAFAQYGCLEEGSHLKGPYIVCFRTRRCVLWGCSWWWFVARSHPSSCLAPFPSLHVGSLSPATLGWSVIHFWNRLHGNYQSRVTGADSSRDCKPHAIPVLFFFLVHLRIFQIKGRPFPVGISSTTPAVASRSAARLTL